MRRSLILIAVVTGGAAGLFIYQIGRPTDVDRNIQWTEWDLRVSTTSVRSFQSPGVITIYPSLFTEPLFFGRGPGDYLFGEVAMDE